MRSFNKQIEIMRKPVFLAKSSIAYIIISSLLFIRAVVDLEFIKKHNSENFCDSKLETSILNPLFGHIFSSCGSLYSIRFFNPNLVAGMLNSCRQYSKDSCKNKQLNQVLNAAIFLFPSPSGVLNHVVNREVNNYKNYFSKEKNRIDNIKQIALLFLRVLNKETSDITKDGSLLYTFSKAMLLITPLNNTEEITAKEKENDHISMLLLIHAYALRVIDTPDEYVEYFNTIQSGFKDQQIYSFEMSKEVFRKIYEMVDDFPYSKLNPPATNAIVPFYNRKTGNFNDKSFFTDCVEVSILHLCNCMFYDRDTKTCTLEHLNLDENSTIIKFYKKFEFKPFDLNDEIRREWCKVIQDLERNDFEIKNDDYKAHLICYSKNNLNSKKDANIDDQKELAANGNELKSGIINFMSALVKICSPGNSESSNLHENEDSDLAFGSKNKKSKLDASGESKSLVEIFKDLMKDDKVKKKICNKFEELLNRLCCGKIKILSVKSGIIRTSLTF